MFTTGSKLLLGATTVSVVAAVAYGLTTGGTLGTIGLIAAAVGFLLLAVINLFERDSTVSSMDHDSFETAAAAQATARPSLWPLLVGVGATLTTLGLVTQVAFTVVGLTLVLAGAVEWAVQGWSERASTSPAFNDAARQTLINPLELPVAGTLLFGVVAFGFSRVMLGLDSKLATMIAFVVVAAGIFLVGVLFYTRKTVSAQTLRGALALLVVVVGVVGIVFGVRGPRTVEAHVTTAELAATDECGPEETEADHHASQSVMDKSNMAARLSYDGQALTASLDAIGSDLDTITLPRSSPSNILFTNDSDKPARLVIDLHPPLDTKGVPTGPERACTALVEEGGSQVLTVLFQQASIGLEAAEVPGYHFTVAGSDAAVDVVVP